MVRVPSVAARPLTALAAGACLVSGAVAYPAVASGARAAHHPTVTVQASDFRFCAAGSTPCLPNADGTTTVKVGTRVVWTYADTACDAVVPCPGHDVVFSKGGGETKLVKADGAKIFSMLFRRPGRFNYFCSAHQSFGMTGTIVVTRH